MCSSPEDLREMASWDGKGLQSRQRLIEKLQSKMPCMWLCCFHEYYILLLIVVMIEQACDWTFFILPLSATVKKWGEGVTF